MKKAVLVVNDLRDMGFSYGTPFDFLGPCTNDLELLDTNPERIMAMVFTGGADIHPNIYGQEPIRQTHWNDHRDMIELEAFNKGREHNVPMIGICRGAQFLCAMEGGSLIQHVNNHYGRHNIQTHDGKTLTVNSVHHQMMVPTDRAQILAWASPKQASIYIIENDELVDVDVEPEAVYWPGINAIGVQYHPEAMPAHSDGARYFREIIIQHLL